MMASRLALVGLMWTLPVAANAANWAEPYYNPKPASGDLVLPLPCGGAMAFRPIDVPLAAGPLQDRPLQLGKPNDDAQGGLDYLEFVRAAFLSAPFPAGTGARRFWLGKYDVTRDQYAAIGNAACAAPTPAGRIPQTNLSWIEAVTAASNWSSWLLQHARAQLPQRGETFAFVRLPTEEEWEYAARGGASVSAEEFLAPTWPMPEGIEAYVSAGPMTGGHAVQIARTRPNPLGLYDMLGNVDQMMMEPFRLNRVGRLHGQAGGIAIRGGDYTMAPSRLNTALRNEIPPFDARTSTPTKLNTLGFRLMLSAPTLGSLAEADAARHEFSSEMADSSGGDGGPQHLIDLLKKQTADATVLNALGRLSATLASNERARADDARMVVRTEIDAATMMSLSAWDRNHVAATQDALAAIEEQNHEPDKAAEDRAVAQHRRTSALQYFDNYMQLVRQIAAAASHAEQFPVERQELRQRDRHAQLLLLDALEKHVTLVSGGMPLTRDEAARDIVGIRDLH